MGYSEPRPRRLVNHIARAAWARIMEQHEWFDGEDAIAAGYQRAFAAEWLRNDPARVTTRAYTLPGVSHRYFPTFRKAWEAAVTDPTLNEADILTVTSWPDIPEDQRGFFPPQYRPVTR